MKRNLNILLVLVLGFTFALAGCNYSTPAPSPGGPWYADPAGDDSNDCLSAANACATVQAAVDKADPGGTVIASAGGFEENVVINKAIILQGAGMGDTIIDANDNGRALAASYASIEIHDLTLRNGNANSVGGNMSNIGADTLMDNVRLEGGTAGFGGGLYNSGNLDLNSVEIMENQADRGGGLYNAPGGQVSAFNIFVENNFVSEAGGGLFNIGDFVASDSQIRSNTADGDGGGIFNDTGGGVEFRQSNIAENSAVGGYSGGGFYNRGDFTMFNSTVVGNSAEYFGGGGYNIGQLALNNIRFEENVAEVGGGGLSLQQDSIVATITDSDFLSNSARVGGGLVMGGPLNITGGAFRGNQATVGGAVASGGLLTMSGTILEGNQARDGGAFSSTRGEQNLINVSILNNISTTSGQGAGGGIHARGQAVRIFITDSLIEGNETLTGAGDRLGGGIFQRDGYLVIAGSTIRNNMASAGGGIAISGGIEFELHNSLVEENHASDNGGGISLLGVYNEFVTSTALIRRSTISANTTDGSGAGLYSIEPEAIIDQSTIAGNSAGDDGGGLLLRRGNITDSTISDNEAMGSGGGLFVASGDPVILNNVTVSGNQAQSTAGIRVLAGELDLRYVTLANNQGQSGGALTVSGRGGTGSANLLATILALNSGANCSGSSIFSTGANITDDLSCPIGQVSGVENASVSLGPLQNNGGLTDTHALPADSPAIDTDACQNNSEDQRGEPRPVGNGCDSGAYERQLELVATTVESPGLCEAGGNFTDAKFRSISLRQDQGLLIVLDVPGGLPEDVPEDGYPARLNGLDYRCTADPAYPDRLFCLGPEPGTNLGSFSLFLPTCPDPIFETEFTVPIRPTPVPTPTTPPPGYDG